MFTCPNKDVHSIYLDGELSDEFKTQYEKHIASCPKCQKELGRISTLRSLLDSDKKTISLTKRDMDSSFERLEARLSYSKVARPVLTLGERSRGAIKDVIIGAAAAVAVAFVLPLNTKTTVPVQNFQPVARMTSLEMPAAFQFDEEFSAENVTGLFADENAEKKVSFVQAHDSLAAAVMPFGTTLVNTSAEKNVAVPISLSTYDVFNPLQEEKTIAESKNKGFFLHLSSPLFSLDIGNDK